jgi:hypothetical protein
MTRTLENILIEDQMAVTCLSLTLLIAVIFIALAPNVQCTANMCGAAAGGSIPLQFEPPTAKFAASSAPGGENFLKGKYF